MGGFIGATNLRASKNGVNVGSRSKVNFVEGANVTLTITDDTVNDEIDIEIASTGGGGGVSDGDKGDITVSGIGTVWTIDADAVTFAKMQNLTDNRLLGRSAGSDGDIQPITVGTGLSLSGGTLTATGGSGPANTDALTEGATNLYFTDERAQDAIGLILADSTTLDFTYNDATPSITATVKNNSINGDMIIDGEISTGKLSNDAVTTLKISNEAVTTEKIASDALYGRIWATQKGYLFM